MAKSRGKGRRRFTRATDTRSYRRLFVIAAEGRETEKQYFALFNKSDAIVRVKFLQDGNKSAPKQVLSRMREFLRQERVGTNDQSWLVIDRDSWEPEHIVQLHSWADEHANRGLALSNPKFEFWLLLHFEDGRKAGDPNVCDARLKHHLPGYKKHIKPVAITDDKIQQAIDRAKQRDNPPCDWPQKQGITTVYRLVEALRLAGGTVN